MTTNCIRPKKNCTFLLTNRDLFTRYTCDDNRLNEDH